MPYHVSSNIIKASELLCSSILTEAGGPAAVGNSIGHPRQYIYKYINLGYVPLKKVYDLSKLLNVPVWSLNYPELLEIHGEDSPSFPSVVEKSNLLPALKERILKVYDGL